MLADGCFLSLFLQPQAFRDKKTESHFFAIRIRLLLQRRIPRIFDQKYRQICLFTGLQIGQIIVPHLFVLPAELILLIIFDAGKDRFLADSAKQILLMIRDQFLDKEISPVDNHRQMVVRQSF